MNYNFEWDPLKAQLNHKKHAIRFEEAATVFRDPKALTIFDQDHSEIEDRWITMGISKKGRLLIVCHTFQEESKNSVTIRIFSSRKAIKKESRLYGG
ncbi:MAG: BrnT family toxin [Desulfobacterales bacterium]|nr:BrnT family toxin [Desulfobacterales bacterium]